MTVEEKLENLIRLLKESNFAERLKESKDKWEIFDDEIDKIQKELKDFKEEAFKQFTHNNYTILDMDYEVLPEKSLEIVLICLMTGLDDDDMLTNCTELPIALRQVKGNLNEVAVNIADFLEGKGKESPGYFSDYEYGQEFIEKFF